jgi:branched-chain amino acid transport system ATP-binding protein
LLDEPSLGLAPLIIEQIFAAIDKLRKSLGMTVVLVEQNAASALEIADTGVILNLGELVASGNAQDLMADPALKSAYLGY